MYTKGEEPLSHLLWMQTEEQKMEEIWEWIVLQPDHRRISNNSYTPLSLQKVLIFVL